MTSSIRTKLRAILLLAAERIDHRPVALVQDRIDPVLGAGNNYIETACDQAALYLHHDFAEARPLFRMLVELTGVQGAEDPDFTEGWTLEDRVLFLLLLRESLRT